MNIVRELIKLVQTSGRSLVHNCKFRWNQHAKRLGADSQSCKTALVPLLGANLKNCYRFSGYRSFAWGKPCLTDRSSGTTIWAGQLSVELVSGVSREVVAPELCSVRPVN